MMILDKSELKNTFNLGTVKDLRKIFLLQGTLLSVFGEIGLLLGIVIVLLQQHFQLVMITLPSLPGSFHDRKRIDCYGNDYSWLYRFTDCE
jgi:hypothetical protein